jgi:hypothetical protein
MASMTKRLKELMQRAETWPDEVQERAIASLEAIEELQSRGDDLTDKDWEIIGQRIDAARRGEIATDEEVAAVFDRHRRV